MNTVPPEVLEIARQLREGEKPPRVSVRQLLRWFDVSRRGYIVVHQIRAILGSQDVITVPDFDSVFIDAYVDFASASATATQVEPQPEEPAAAIPVEEDDVLSGAIEDPTYRIGKLEAANRRPVSVSPDCEVGQAFTLMMMNDYSQLPVMTNERDVKGVISWTSVGKRVALNKTFRFVRDCMDVPAQEISYDRSLFAAIAMIASEDYVLVRDESKSISGIVTTSDLSFQFRHLAEPFLLIGEVENHLRRIVADAKFTKQELQGIKDQDDVGREVSSVSDLTFGEYIRLLEEPGRWAKVGLAIDRTVFIDRLNRVRKIRNDVVHFDPDPLPDEDLNELRQIVKFLQQLREIAHT